MKDDEKWGDVETPKQEEEKVEIEMEETIEFMKLKFDVE